MTGPLSRSAHLKLERRIVEKNRRNHLKVLYSQLFSLLPNHPSKEAVPLPDQIDEAMSYIKGLQVKLERFREKKEALLMGRRREDDSSTGGSMETLKSSPRIQIRHKGSALDVFLITGHDEKFMFYETIRIIQEQGAEVVNANFSVHGDSIFHVVHAKVKLLGNLVLSPACLAVVPQRRHAAAEQIIILRY
uniref:Transcription factor bHLH6 n=1 Tax=Diospyros kaki TaxID=35925 RepID=A0A3S8T940_DIOKA|nr:transcription factor bHLH6 [Diospyros kaki]